jgi:multimeric flavodoxin WrbA
MAKVAVIYYSQTGTTHLLAEAVEQGASEAGAETRLLKVKETASDEVWGNNPAWKQHREETSGVREATNDDLEWADAVILGTPTRYGLPSAQLKNFLDQTGGLWAKGGDGARRSGSDYYRNQYGFLSLRNDNRRAWLRRSEPVSIGKSIRRFFYIE